LKLKLQPEIVSIFCDFCCLWVDGFLLISLSGVIVVDGGGGVVMR